MLMLLQRARGVSWVLALAKGFSLPRISSAMIMPARAPPVMPAWRTPAETATTRVQQEICTPWMHRLLTTMEYERHTLARVPSGNVVGGSQLDVVQRVLAEQVEVVNGLEHLRVHSKCH